MKRRTKIVLIVFSAVLLLFFGISYFIGTQVFMGSTQLVTCEDTKEVKDSFWEKYDINYEDFCNTYQIEKIEISSTFDEHMIPADYIDFVYHCAPEKVIGVWGTSFGGATAGLAMENKDVENKVDFLILDCPVSDMKWMVEEEMRKMDIGLPISYMTFCGNIINKKELGFSYEDANVCDAIGNIEVPILIINSKDDTLTPQFMGQDIYDAINNDAFKTIWTVDESEHTEIWLDYNQDYREKVEELLKDAK